MSAFQDLIPTKTPTQSTGAFADLANKPTITPAAPSQPQSSKNTGGVLGFLSGLVGGDKLAQGVGRSIFNAGTDQAAQATQGDQVQNAQRLQLIRELGDPTISPDVKAHIQDFLNKNGTGGVDTNQLNDITTANLTNKEVLGSAAQLGTTFAGMALPGASSLVGKVAQGAGLGYASDIATNAEQGNSNIFKHGYGTLVGGSLPLVSKLVGALGKQVLAKTTGAGVDVLQHALDNPSAVNKAINEYATTPEAQQSLVDKAKGAIGDFLHQRGVEYGKGLDSLPVIKTGKQDVVQSFTDNVGQFGGKVENGTLKFSDTTLTKQDQNNLKQVFAVINKWNDTSMKGLDGLRQAIGNHMDEFKALGNSRANVVLGNVKNALTTSLKSNSPEYAKMLSDYGSKSQVARDIMKELSLGGQAKPSTQLSSVMRLFKKDPSVIQNLEKVMGKEKAAQFQNEISGAILSHWFPPGVVGNAARAVLEGGGAAAIGATAGLAHGAMAGAAALAASSPRVVGKGAVLLGKAIKSGVGTGITRATTIAASRLNQSSLSQTPLGQISQDLSSPNPTPLSPQVQRRLNMLK